jgi:outer membrane protein
VQRKNEIRFGQTLARGLAAALAVQAIVVLGAPAVAQTMPSSASTMALLARTVVASSPEIQAQREQVRIARARLASAKAGFLPSIEANGLVQKREIDVKSGGPGDAKFIAGQASVEARLRVYDGNRTFNAVRVAKSELAAAEAVLDATISDVLLKMLTYAADVHLDRKVRQYSQLQSDAIGEQLRATSRRLEFGESTRTDESLAKARLATSQAGILAATEELNVSGYKFREVTGQSATIVPPLPKLAPPPDSLVQAQSLAVIASPRLLAAQRNAEAGKTGVYFANGALMPQLDAVGGYEYLTGGVANLFTGKLPDDRSALYGGIELRVPVFQPRDYAEISRAKAVRDQRLSQTEMAIRAMTDEVATAWTRWQSAKNTIVAAEAAVAAIEQAAEGIKKESIGGNRTLAEVLDAQNELLSARVTLERAIRNEFVARAGLLAATGGLKAESVLDGGAVSKVGMTSRPEVSMLGRRPSDVPPAQDLASKATR